MEPSGDTGMTTLPSYVPVLRWKSGEQQALRRLGEDVSDYALRLVELPSRECMSPAKRKKSESQLTRELVAEIEECWPDRRALMDLSLFPSNGEPSVHPVTAVFDSAAHRGLRLVDSNSYA